MEKEVIEKDKLRLSIVEELLKETSGDIPEILIQSETDKILYKLEADITNMGFKFDEYLIQIKKTEDDLRKEWRTDAEKRAKLQLTIHNISNKENLKPTEEEIEKEVTNIVTMYKDADPIRARAYVENMMENEKVFQFLEAQ
jgi:trigger factor